MSAPFLTNESFSFNQCRLCTTTVCSVVQVVSIAVIASARLGRACALLEREITVPQNQRTPQKLSIFALITPLCNSIIATLFTLSFNIIWAYCNLLQMATCFFVYITLLNICHINNNNNNNR